MDKFENWYTFFIHSRARGSLKTIAFFYRQMLFGSILFPNNVTLTALVAVQPMRRKKSHQADFSFDRTLRL